MKAPWLNLFTPHPGPLPKGEGQHNPGPESTTPVAVPPRMNSSAIITAQLTKLHRKSCPPAMIATTTWPTRRVAMLPLSPRERVRVRATTGPINNKFQILWAVPIMKPCRKAQQTHVLLRPNYRTTEPPNYRTTEPPNYRTTGPPNHQTTGRPSQLKFTHRLPP